MDMIERGKRLYLCRSDAKIITTLNGLQTDSVSYARHVKDFDTIEFTVDRYINVDGVELESNGYEDLKVYMYIMLEDGDLFQITDPPTLTSDGEKETKTVTASSIEKELYDKNILSIKMNCGTKDSVEMLVDDNVDSMGYAKEFIDFYNPTKPQLSMLNLLLDDLPQWSIDSKDIDRDLWETRLMVDESSTNVYAVLTSVIGPKAECLFLFDKKRRKIKAIAKKNLESSEYDTSVYIGLKNLANSIQVTSSTDAVYTKINCRGDNDLSFDDINYGDSSVINLSYLMCHPYMDDDLIRKVKAWQEWRENNREAYINKQKEAVTVNTELKDCYEHLPLDGVKYDQWDQMSEELLQKNLTLYYDMANQLPADSEVRYEIMKYIIPNIKIAIGNLNKNADDKDSYERSYEYDWQLYGLAELRGKKAELEGIITTQKEYAEEFSSLPEEKQRQYSSENSYTLNHNRYKEAVDRLNGTETVNGLLSELWKRETEYVQLEGRLNSIMSQISPIEQQAKMVVSNFGFTEEDIKLLNSYLISSDYTNSNILTTSYQTELEKFDVKMELYKDCVSKASELSQPQYSFTTELDNLLRLPEFEPWKDDFQLLKYIHLAVRDDYVTKLRLVGITYNPCEITPELTLEFSNMITSASGRSDLTALLNDGNLSGSKNQISIGTGNARTDLELAQQIMDLLKLNGSGFNTSVGGIADQSRNYYENAYMTNFLERYLKDQTINFGKIIGAEAEFNKLVAENATIQNLNAQYATISGSLKTLSQVNLMSDYDSFENITDNLICMKYYCADLSITDEEAYHGYKSLKIKSTSDTEEAIVALGTPLTNYGCVPVEYGKSYYISAYFKSNTSSKVSFATGDHKTIQGYPSVFYVLKQAVVGTEWTRVWGKYEAKNGYPYVSLKITNYTPGTTIYADAIQIEEVGDATEPRPFQPAIGTIITGNQIKTGALQSSNYVYKTGEYTTKGSLFDLDNGIIRTTNFYVNAAAENGQIGLGPFHVTDNSIYKGTNGLTAGKDNIYIGKDGVQIGEGFSYNANDNIMTIQGVLHADRQFFMYSTVDGKKYERNAMSSLNWIDAKTGKDKAELSIGNSYESVLLTGDEIHIQPVEMTYIDAPITFNHAVTFADNTKINNTWSINDNKIYGTGQNGETIVIQRVTEKTEYTFASGGSDHGSYEDCPFRVNKNGEMWVSDLHVMPTGSFGEGKLYVSDGTVHQSDENNKTILGNLTDQKYEHLFRSLKPIQYRWKNKNSRIHYGLGAQTVERTINEAGLESDDIAIVDRNDDGTYGLDYQGLQMLTMQMTQKSLDRIDELEAEIAELKALVKQLTK